MHCHRYTCAVGIHLRHLYSESDTLADLHQTDLTLLFGYRNHKMTLSKYNIKLLFDTCFSFTRSEAATQQWQWATMQSNWTLWLVGNPVYPVNYSSLLIWWMGLEIWNLWDFISKGKSFWMQCVKWQYLSICRYTILLAFMFVFVFGIFLNWKMGKCMSISQITKYLLRCLQICFPWPLG